MSKPFDPADFPTYPAADFFALMDGTSGTAPPKAAPKIPPKSPEAAGGRNNYLTSLAGTLRNRGEDADAIEAMLLARNAEFEDPLGDHEVRDIARSSERFKVATRKYPCTDTGNAERFADSSADLKYCAERGKWYWWDGRVWNEDTKDTRAIKRAIEVARSIYASNDPEDDPDIRKAGRAWARKSEAAARLAAMVQVARSMDTLRASIGDFDPEPWALNLPNGILNLRTGQLGKHDSARMCTRMAKAPFVPGARSEVFERYLAWATQGSAEVAGFLQRALGYSLTGDTSGQCLFMVIGLGGSGKTTLIEALKDLLGTYASTTRAETLLERRNDDGPRNDLAAINGMRLIGVSEIKKGKTLDHGVIKSLAGSDTMSARFLYGEPFSFKPIAKLWLAANDAPKVDIQDTGMWRRIIRIPFDQVVPEKDRDPDLPAKLAEPDCLAAILAWAVQGCLDWQARGRGKAGLAEPASIRKATSDYRRDLNPLNDFLADVCEIDPQGWAPALEVREAYAVWARRSGIRPVGVRQFTALMESAGIIYETRDAARGYAGVRLLQGGPSRELM